MYSLRQNLEAVSSFTMGQRVFHQKCGCYMPYKVMMGGKCWGDENGVSDEDIGWGDAD